MNTFLVLSPFQIINALEAREFFGAKDNILVVLRHTSSGYPISMFKPVVDEADWKQVYYFSTYGEERVGQLTKYTWAYLSWLQQRRLDQLAKTLKRTDGLFVGSYLEPLVRHFTNKLPHQTLYVLDSGTDTLLVNKAREEPSTATFSRPSRMSLLSKLLGVKDQQAERATFFTMFDIEVQPKDTLVPNHYPYLRTLASLTPSGDEVWFLGGSLVTDGYVSEAVYLHHLEHAYRFYRGKRFIYLPHGREQEADVERIKNLLGCEIRRYGVPVELALSRANPRPHEVASFITAALPSCHAIFGSTLQITAIYIDPENFPKYHDFASAIYQQFYHEADDSFRVLKLEDLAEAESS